MDCPNCHQGMNKVKTVSHYGIAIDLDQCPECGGLWFDTDEIYHVKHGEAQKLDDVDAAKLKNISPVREKLNCPRDNIVLEPFFDPLFPSTIKVEQCRQCGGFWFNRGEFASFQAERNKRRTEREDKARQEEEKKFDKQVAGLLNTQSSTNTYATVGRLGKFLSTPVDAMNFRPIGFMDANVKEDDKNDEIIFFALYIIRMLLKLFLKV